MEQLFADVAVGIPTVRSRAEALAATVAEWRRFGVTPLVQLQPDDWPHTGESARRNGDALLARVLDECRDARYILYCEDDVLLSPELPYWIPACKHLNAPVTLVLDGERHYPSPLRSRLRSHNPLPERIFLVHKLHEWWGSQCVWLPREIAEQVRDWPSRFYCWDVHLQQFLLQHGVPLYSVFPNLAQHRDVVSSLHPDRHVLHSRSFGLAGDGSAISPPHDNNWCVYGAWHPDPRALDVTNRVTRR